MPESCGKFHLHIPLWEEKYHLSEDLCSQLMYQLNTSHFALQVDEVIGIVKDAHLITYVWFVFENCMKENCLFFEATDGTTTSLEVLNIINHYVEENEINWDICIGMCTDRAQPLPGQNAGLQALVRKKAPHII